MPIRNFEDWEQAVLDRRLAEMQSELQTSLSPRPRARIAFDLDRLLLKKWGKRIGILLLGGGLLWFAIDQLPERLEPLLSLVQDLLSQLQNRPG